MTSSEDIFPKPGRLIHGIFRCCGSCPRCVMKQKHMESEMERTSIEMRCLEGIRPVVRIFHKEYILICSSGKAPPIFSQMTSNNPPGYYISNYGRQFRISDNGRGCELSGGTGVGWSSNNDHGREGLSPLTQEFINYYNSIDFWGGQWNHIFRMENSNKMIMEYQKRPIIKTAYKVERDKLEIQDMTKELQKKETEVVNQQKHLKSMKEELLLQEAKLKENEEKLKVRVTIHKKKSLDLFERENKISVKGSVETILKELLEVSSSISSILELEDSPILIDRINQIIVRLNHIRSTGGPRVQEDEEVIIATEILPEPSAPQPGSWMREVYAQGDLDELGENSSGEDNKDIKKACSETIDDTGDNHHLDTDDNDDGELVSQDNSLLDLAVEQQRKRDYITDQEEQVAQAEPPIHILLPELGVSGLYSLVREIFKESTGDLKQRKKYVFDNLSSSISLRIIFLCKKTINRMIDEVILENSNGPEKIVGDSYSISGDGGGVEDWFSQKINNLSLMGKEIERLLLPRSLKD